MITIEGMNQIVSAPYRLDLRTCHRLFEPHGHYHWDRLQRLNYNLLTFIQLLDEQNKLKILEWINTLPEK